MIQTQKARGNYNPIGKDADFGFYGSAYSRLSVEKEGYEKLAIFNSVPRAESPFCISHFRHTGSLLQVSHKHPSFIIGQNDREIAYLKETIFEMKRRLSLLERNREGSPIYMRVVNIQNKPADEIYKMVLDYYNSHPVAYPDEVADALSLDLQKVIEVVDQLIAEDKIEVAI